MNHLAKTVCLFGIAGLLNTAAYAGNSLIVANDGVDSLTCGTPGNPCRSISQAIHNAGAGATIIVGPGLYGEINGDGVFTNAGEEAAEVSTGCNCMIKVDKSVSIFSSDGADVTIIDAATNFIACVNIQASDVTFGAKGKGFTLTMGNIGMLINSNANHVTVAGNRAAANQSIGFFCDTDSSSNLFTGNVAFNNTSIGFELDGFGHQAIGNVSAANAVIGFEVQNGTAVVLKGNVSTANPIGAHIGPGNTVVGNSFVGNQFYGIGIANPVSFTKNNIFSDPLCSLENDGGTLTASGNFFGSAAGPGADPSSFCGDPNIISTPFATKAIKVKVTEP